MEKWRVISGIGIILGIVVIAIDFGIENVPYVITISLEVVAIVLIFAGLIIRKCEKRRKK